MGASPVQVYPAVEAEIRVQLTDPQDEGLTTNLVHRRLNLRSLTKTAIVLRITDRRDDVVYNGSRSCLSKKTAR